MTTLYFLVGLPASGKTTYAKKLELQQDNIIRLSSDDLREELFGDRTYQKKNKELFIEMNKRAKEYLKQGVNVIYDATNINSKRRMGFLKQLPHNIHKKCIYFTENIRTNMFRDFMRDTNVGYDVIKRMYKQLQIPMWHEGWDEIQIIRTDNDIKKDFYAFDFNPKCYDEYVFLLEKLGIEDIIDMPQDNPYHTLSVSRHMYYTFQNVKEYNNEYLNIASLFHDIGKGVCKQFNGKYASFLGHQNVSAQKIINILKDLNVDDDEIIDVATLIQLHMLLKNKDFGEKSKNRLKNKIGEKLYNELEILNIADNNAK